jgi:hypothetical protein
MKKEKNMKIRNLVKKNKFNEQLWSLKGVTASLLAAFVSGTVTYITVTLFAMWELDPWTTVGLAFVIGVTSGWMATTIATVIINTGWFKRKFLHLHRCVKPTGSACINTSCCSGIEPVYQTQYTRRTHIDVDPTPLSYHQDIVDWTPGSDNTSCNGGSNDE